MDKTTTEQINISPESSLWEELSDQACATCVGGKLGALFGPGDLKGYLRQFRRNQRIYRYLFRNS
jgi:hypothetical protein